MTAAKTRPYAREQLRRAVYLAAFGFDWHWSDRGEDDPAALEDKTRLCDLVHVDDILYFFPGDLKVIHQFQFTTEDWAQWLGLGDQHGLHDRRQIGLWLRRYRRGQITTTVGDLIDFLALHAEAIAFEPVALLGRRCEAAGVMLGLERLCHEVEPDASRVAPSSTIVGSLSHWKLEWFWMRLRVLLADRVPPLPSATEYEVRQRPPAGLQRAERIAGPLTLLCVPIIVILAFLACMQVMPIAEGIWKPLGPIVIGAFMLVMIATSWLLYEAMCHLFGYVPPLDPLFQAPPPVSQPLPPGIQTFRDLAIWIVDHPPTHSAIG